VPTEPRALAKFEQAASIEYAQFDPIASTIASEKVFKPHYGQVTNEALVTELVAKLDGKLDVYEVILGKQKYLAGNVRHARSVSEDEVVLMGSFLLQEVTLADLFHLPYGNIVFDALNLGGLDGRPNVKR
jgi:glutathione S-transferase